MNQRHIGVVEDWNFRATGNFQGAKHIGGGTLQIEITRYRRGCPINIKIL